MLKCLRHRPRRRARCMRRGFRRAGRKARNSFSSRGRSSIRPERRSMARSSQAPGAVKARRPDAAPPGSLGTDGLDLVRRRGGRRLTILRLLGRRRRRLALIRRRGSRRPTVPRLLGRPVAKRVRERDPAERDQSSHEHEIPRSPAAKHIHESGDHARFREGTQVDTALVRAGAGRTAGAPLLEDSIRRRPPNS